MRLVFLRNTKMLSSNSLVQTNNNNNNSTVNPVVTTVQPNDGVTTKLDKSEINEAVAKVLQGYDWTLVPIATK